MMKLFDDIENGAKDDEIYNQIHSFLLENTNSGKLYKYRAFDEKGRALGGLTSNTLFCAEPDKFNDPFDCKIGITVGAFFEAAIEQEMMVAEHTFEKYIAVVQNEVLIDALEVNEKNVVKKLLEYKAFSQFVLDGYNFISEDERKEYLYKNIGIVSEIIGIILSDERFSEGMHNAGRTLPNLIRKSTPEAVMQLIDGDVSISDFARANGIVDDADEINLAIKMISIFYSDATEATELLQSAFEQLETDVVERLMRIYKVGCLSADYKNSLMWSHYADSHKGFCVEYDFSETEEMTMPMLPLPVVYSDNRPLIPWSVVFNNTRENQSNLTKQILLALLTKDNAWGYEKEWRIMVDAKQSPFCQMPRISCVYLGACVSDENRERVIAIAKEKRFMVKQMVLDRGVYALHESTVHA